MGAAPRRLSGEDFNVELEVTEIVRHPDFNPKYGVEAGNDLAIFKIDEEAKGCTESQSNLPS